MPSLERSKSGFARNEPSACCCRHATRVHRAGESPRRRRRPRRGPSGRSRGRRAAAAAPGRPACSAGSWAAAARTARTSDSGRVTSSAGPATSGSSKIRARSWPARCRSWPICRWPSGRLVASASTGAAPSRAARTARRGVRPAAPGTGRAPARAARSPAPPAGAGARRVGRHPLGDLEDGERRALGVLQHQPARRRRARRWPARSA